jgi:hypothetical protein
VAQYERASVLSPLQVREDLFQMPHTEYPLLVEVRASFEPVAALWRLAGCCNR